MSEESGSTRLDQLEAQMSADLRRSKAYIDGQLKRLVDLPNQVEPIERNRLWDSEVIILLAERQNWTCPGWKTPCGVVIDLNSRDRHVDHYIPVKLGGANETSNLQILCKSCNLKKGAKADIDEVI